MFTLNKWSKIIAKAFPEKKPTKFEYKSHFLILNVKLKSSVASLLSHLTQALYCTTTSENTMIYFY